MTKRQAQKLRHGLYRIWWKSGGNSLASVGSMRNGDRWLAPTNWIDERKHTDMWDKVQKITAIIEQ